MCGKRKVESGRPGTPRQAGFRDLPLEVLNGLGISPSFLYDRHTTRSPLLLFSPSFAVIEHRWHAYRSLIWTD